MIKVDDHVALALSRLPAQIAGKTNMRRWLSALVRPFQRLEDALWQIYTLTDVDTATDAALDLLGKLVGEARAGLDDETYRRRIRARIAVNRSKGRTEDLYTVALSVLGATTVTVQLTEDYPAAVIVTLTGAVDQGTADAMIDMLQQAAPAGVRVLLLYTLSSTGSAFTFDVGPGLDVGLLGGSSG